MTNILSGMLLINEPSVVKLHNEINEISGYFLTPIFIISLCLEFIGKSDFINVTKKLFVSILILNSFYFIHSKAVGISLDVANSTLKKVSPGNLFIKKWTEGKIKTKEKSGWGYLESIAIPNLNDLLATTFFVLAKVFTWLLKLIFSSVYHLTYIFSGITALLYFFKWTERSLVGAVQSSLWCILMPFVVVAILALVGNSIDSRAIKGDLAIADIETILWLFGVTLILMISPLITWSMVKGEGIASAGTKFGAIATSAGMKAAYTVPTLLNKNSLSRKALSTTYGASNYLFNDLKQKNNYEKLVKLGAIKKDTFLYDKKYWGKISESNKEAIRNKYGIVESTPKKNMVYYPKDTGRSPELVRSLHKKVINQKPINVGEFFKSDHLVSKNPHPKRVEFIKRNLKGTKK